MPRCGPCSRSRLPSPFFDSHRFFRRSDDARQDSPAGAQQPVERSPGPDCRRLRHDLRAHGGRARGRHRSAGRPLPRGVDHRRDRAHARRAGGDAEGRADLRDGCGLRGPAAPGGALARHRARQRRRHQRRLRGRPCLRPADRHRARHPHARPAVPGGRVARGDPAAAQRLGQAPGDPRLGHHRAEDCQTRRRLRHGSGLPQPQAARGRHAPLLPQPGGLPPGPTC